MHPRTIASEIKETTFKLNHDQISEEEALDLLESNLLQLNNLPWEQFQIQHFEASQELQEIGLPAFPLLLKYLHNKTLKLASKTPFARSQPDVEPCGKNKFLKFYKSNIAAAGKKIRLSTFKIKKPTKKESEQYTDWTIKLLNEAATNITSDDLSDITSALSLLAIFRQLGKVNSRPEEFYHASDMILDRLVRDRHSQSARDICEEIVACSLQDQLKVYGHWCKTNLLTRQKNPIEAAFNGCLMYSAIEEADSLPEQSQYRILKSSLTLFRDCGLSSLLEGVHSTVQNYSFLSSYDKESLAVMAIYGKLLNDPLEAAASADRYASQHIDNITNGGRAALESWYTLICNCKNFSAFLFDNFKSLEALYLKADDILGIEWTERMRGLILSDQHNTKDLVVSLFDRLHLTRNKSDHIHEINLLQLTVRNLITRSIDDNDVDGLLIGHRAKSDGELAFELSPGLKNNTLIKFGGINPPPRPLTSAYTQKCLNAITKHNAFDFMWLGESHENIYSINFKNGSTKATVDFYADLANEWGKWIKTELHNMAFDDTPKTGPFETREDVWGTESTAIKAKLPAIKIPMPGKETIIFSDIEAARLPHNLAFDTNNPLPATCNSLTPDLFNTYDTVTIDHSSLSIWAPIKEEDRAISLAHARLTEFFPEEGYQYFVDNVPPQDDHHDIKAFICHGGRNEQGGFDGLYLGNGKGFTTNHIFGSGKVAILFICHGAHIHPAMYARAIQTLAKTLILDGYQSVVAPAWSLNVVIPGPWLNAFTASLDNGDSIVRAVQCANNHIRSLYPVESAWAAMHLFGNPLISKN